MERKVHSLKILELVPPYYFAYPLKGFTALKHSLSKSNSISGGGN